ncbi:MAG: hypothetical protein BRC58_10165 [Cyanobacteria bacterium QS_8_64_29]|nr:MAG: hypothetical protein BRC58_10165 [Cyanobacteria bacterium QS_8_64_29]
MQAALAGGAIGDEIEILGLGQLHGIDGTDGHLPLKGDDRIAAKGQLGLKWDLPGAGFDLVGLADALDLELGGPIRWRPGRR